MDRGSQKQISNQSSHTPRRTTNLNSRIMLNQTNDLDTRSDKDMANQISFTPKSLSSRMNPNQSHDGNKGSDKDKENHSSFTPTMSSNPNSRIKRNLSDDSDTGSEQDIGNQISLHQKDHQLQVAVVIKRSQMIRTQTLTQIWRI